MNSSRTGHAFRSHPLVVAPAGLALLLVSLALVAPARADRGRDDRAPDLGDCQDLRVPAGNRVSFHVFGVGVQIYTWTGTAWSFVSPEALLFAVDEDLDADDRAEEIVGFHFAGPTWESLSGSQVVGTTDVSCTPNPDAIPWLRVKAVSNAGHGPFQRVTYIQRLNTVGGQAPTTPGTFPGQVARVPYSADYFFYQRHR